MRLVGARLGRAAGASSNAVARRPEAAAALPPAVAEGGGGGALAERAGQRAAAVHSHAEALAGRAQSAGQRLFRGSCDGTAYAADSPILGQVFGPAPRHEPVACSTTATASPVVVPPPAAPRSLQELQTLPATELRRMLSSRGVGLGSATEKAELAQWVFQHQDLPEVRGGQAASTSPAAPAERAFKSVAELRRKPVAELRDMLAERGVDEGSTTEKDDLVEWVWQHQHLPVLHTGRERQRTAGRRFRPGFGAHSEPYDSPRDEARSEKPEHERLEGSDPKQLEGAAGQGLLEGGTAAQELPRHRWWAWPAAGLGCAFVGVWAALAINDASRAAAEMQVGKD